MITAAHPFQESFRPPSPQLSAYDQACREAHSFHNIRASFDLSGPRQSCLAGLMDAVMGEEGLRVQTFEDKENGDRAQQTDRPRGQI